MAGKEPCREAVDEVSPRLWATVQDGQVVPAEGDDARPRTVVPEV